MRSSAAGAAALMRLRSKERALRSGSASFARYSSTVPAPVTRLAGAEAERCGRLDAALATLAAAFVREPEADGFGIVAGGKASHNFLASLRAGPHRRRLGP